MTRLRISPAARVDVALCLLAVVAVGVGAAAGLLFHAPTITRIVRARPAAAVALRGMSGAKVAHALGKPDETIAGSRVSSALTGFECGVWQSRGLLACWQ